MNKSENFYSPIPILSELWFKKYRGPQLAPPPHTGMCFFGLHFLLYSLKTFPLMSPLFPSCGLYFIPVKGWSFPLFFLPILFQALFLISYARLIFPPTLLSCFFSPIALASHMLQVDPSTLDQLHNQILLIPQFDIPIKITRICCIYWPLFLGT